jgi:hypothetical protein
MNMKMSRNKFFSVARLVAVLLLVEFFTLPSLRAQPAEGKVPGRFLFIFDTSSNLKKCLPAVQKTLTSMLATSLGGQMHTGDTIGVWTFNQELHWGDVPLQVWDADDAATIAGNITKFLGSQKYANTTHFETLQPLLNRVVQNSQRLTVVIFCDGATKITGTTFDTGINQLFEQNAAAQKKARQPIVVLLRAQLGKFVGCTVSYPPQPVSFPEFPPLPEPPPAPKPPPVPQPAAAVVTPSIIITGTKVEGSQPPVQNSFPTNPPTMTNLPPVIQSAPTNVAPAGAPVGVPAKATNPPSAVLPAMPTNVVPPEKPPAPINEPVIVPPENPIMPANVSVIIPGASPVVPTNAHALVPANISVAAAENSGDSGKKWLLIGGIFLVAAGLVAVLAFFYFRRNDNRSLISRSMHDK